MQTPTVVYITNGRKPTMLHLSDCPHQMCQSIFRDATAKERSSLRWCSDCFRKL